MPILEQKRFLFSESHPELRDCNTISELASGDLIILDNIEKSSCKPNSLKTRNCKFSITVFSRQSYCLPRFRWEAQRGRVIISRIRNRFVDTQSVRLSRLSHNGAGDDKRRQYFSFITVPDPEKQLFR